jgi:uroporphyrinogen-III synthase
MGRLIKHILVSQPEPADLKKSPFRKIIENYKVNVSFRKFIKIEGVSASEFRKDKVYLTDYTAVIFTSRNAIDHFFRIAKEMRIEIPQSMKYFCISESTAFYLQKYIQYRKRKTFFGNQNFEELIELIEKHDEERFLLPCSNIHKLKIIDLLNEAGVDYSKAVIYETVGDNLSDLTLEDYDMIVFYSPGGVTSFLKNFPDFDQKDVLIAAFGPTTIKSIEKANLKVNIKAPTQTALSMTAAIEEYLKELKKKK